ncbi:MAG: DegT/DnrJ/EryC1/StrS family aminotransferase [Cetobacterium sp.]
MIPIYDISIKKYTTSALKAINENWINNYGVNVKNTENLLTKILGVKYCILMNNGTSATHCLLISLKHRYPNIKKIYVPNNGFCRCLELCINGV